jgi:hypothetical protein
MNMLRRGVLFLAALLLWTGVVLLVGYLRTGKVGDAIAGVVLGCIAICVAFV